MNEINIQATTIRKEGLDKFYTNTEYAKKCIDKVFQLYNSNDFHLIIEPSAGSGSFFNQIYVTDSQKKIGIDISPDSEQIIKQDFLQFTPSIDFIHNKKQRILVIGNPPFGKVCSLAIKFFNHAAEWCDVIAFIVPRTFRRPSVQNKLNTAFHLFHDEDVPANPCCFVPKISVKCCFQIWEKKTTPREIMILHTTHPHWNFLPFGSLDDKGQPTPPQNADFAIRAYGGKIGEIKIGEDVLRELRPKSWHWIKVNTNSSISVEELINRFNHLNYSDSTNTARQNSMGKGELIRLYMDSYE